VRNYGEVKEEVSKVRAGLTRLSTRRGYYCMWAG
jgi:hypothetical protein